MIYTVFSIPVQTRRISIVQPDMENIPVDMAALSRAMHAKRGVVQDLTQTIEAFRDKMAPEVVASAQRVIAAFNVSWEEFQRLEESVRRRTASGSLKAISEEGPDKTE
jgi:hypothetical protein